jgi:hypothetical protein
VVAEDVDAGAATADGGGDDAVDVGGCGMIDSERETTGGYAGGGAIGVVVDDCCWIGFASGDVGDEVDEVNEDDDDVVD